MKLRAAIPVLRSLPTLSACGERMHRPSVAPAMLSDHSTAQNALDWQEGYAGFQPGADVPVIRITVARLEPNGYVLTKQYSYHSEVEQEKGTFHWNTAGSAISLRDGQGRVDSQYKVIGNALEQLDQPGQTTATYRSA